MKAYAPRSGLVAAAALVTLTMSACTTNQVADNTGDVLGFLGRTTVKTVSAVGKIVYSGGEAAVDAVNSGE